jgi:hypothetical protein
MPPHKLGENLLALIERIHLDNKFHTHKEFFLYLDIEDIIRTCFISKHYLRKYLKFSQFYFIGKHHHVLHALRVYRVCHEDEYQSFLTHTKFYRENDQKMLDTLKYMYIHNKSLRKIIISILQK